MNYRHDSFNVSGADLHQLLSIVNKDHTEISGIKNAEPLSSLVGPHFSTLPINAGSMRNGETSGDSLSQCFSRLTQHAVFAFLAGNGEVEKLPCFDILGTKELHGLSRRVSILDKELIQVKDAVTSQRLIFEFLHGDVCSFLMDFDLESEQTDHFNPDTCEDLSRYWPHLDLENPPDGSVGSDETRHSIQTKPLCLEISPIFHVTGQISDIRDDVSWMITGTTVEDDGFSGEIVENILHSPFHYSQGNVEIASVTDWDVKGVKLGASQCPSIENFSGMFSELNCNVRISQKDSDVPLEDYGSTNENNYEGDVSGISSLLSSNERVPSIFNHSEVDEDYYKNSDSTSTHHDSFDNVSNTLTQWIPKIQSNSIAHFGDTASSNDFGLCEQHPAIGCTEELIFCIPNSDQVMEYLYGDLSSPKFLESKKLDEESVVFDDCDSSEPVESKKLLGTMLNDGCYTAGKNNEDQISDTLGLASESGIKASTGAFGEIETSVVPSLPEPSHVEKILWNWFSRNTESFAFDLEEHQNLLEFYGLDDKHIHAYDEDLCESPTWPEKTLIQENELCPKTSNHIHYDVIWMDYLAPISTMVEDDGFTSEIAEITTIGIYPIDASNKLMKPINQVDEKPFFESSASKTCYHQSFDNVSDMRCERSSGIYNNITSQYGNPPSSNVCGASSKVFGNCGQHLAIRCTEQLTFAIPDPDDLMEYLRGSLSSPKFLASDHLNEESEVFHFSSLLGSHDSDEVAESEYLSNSITNSSTNTGVNDNKNEIFDSFGSETEPQIGALTEGFGEIETPAIRSF